jgi:small subunit ribosomal protein S17
MATETKKKAAPKTTKAVKEAKTASTTEAPALSTAQRRKEIVGTVVSNKMQKTIVVEIQRQVKHSLYKKYVLRSQRFKAHDEKNDAQIGDTVSIVESRPMSRDKRWALQKIVRRAVQTGELNA